jgi:type I restriction enzyme R subunit
VSRFTESVVEDAALAWLEALHWRVLHGPEIAPGELVAERTDYGQVGCRFSRQTPTFQPTARSESISDLFPQLALVAASCAPRPIDI